jgi:hypothetical protein
MLAPIKARFASSCSRKGISDAATDTIWPGSNVHILDFGRLLQFELALETTGDQRIGQAPFLVELGIGLGDHVLALLDRRQVLNLIGDMAVIDALRYGVSMKP